MDPTGKSTHTNKTRITARVYRDTWLFEKYLKVDDVKQGGAVTSANEDA